MKAKVDVSYPNPESGIYPRLDDAVCSDIDAVLTQLHAPVTCCDECSDADEREAQMSDTTPELSSSTFADIINQWTETLLEENKNADLLQVALILRLGTLGQRLIYAAHTAGLNDALKISKEVHNV